MKLKSPPAKEALIAQAQRLTDHAEEIHFEFSRLSWVLENTAPRHKYTIKKLKQDQKRLHCESLRIKNKLIRLHMMLQEFYYKTS